MFTRFWAIISPMYPLKQLLKADFQLFILLTTISGLMLISSCTRDTTEIKSEEDLNKEIIELEKIANQPSSDYKVYYNLGIDYAQKGEVLKGIENLNKAIELNPKHAQSYNNLGYIYIKINDYNNAIANLRFAAMLEPNDGLIYYNLGIAYYNNHDYLNALKSFKQAKYYAPQLTEKAEAFINKIPAR